MMTQRAARSQASSAVFLDTSESQGHAGRSHRRKDNANCRATRKRIGASLKRPPIAAARKSSQANLARGRKARSKAAPEGLGAFSS
ncbi:hypothetical protein B1812_15205 [Methylocystis bryophila]|uniref:Uncharacterized protein n=1 Tax=Methylocystis bryophila TaxID=655015 RepID=A0A1W6MX98_9HYPH|nr:hypothetical protein B1812_15205 [Methylocystis bryophila]